jgi:hypothetical protein
LADAITGEGTAAVAAEAAPAAEAVAAAAPAAAATATTGDNGEAKAAEQAGDGQGAAKPDGGDAAKPEGEKPAGDDQGAKPEAKAPAEYAEFKAPEGVQLGEALPADLKSLAKELDLTQDQAQAVFDLGVKQAQNLATRIAEGQVAQQAVQREAWADQSKADPEFGGDKFDANLAVANRAFKQFGSPAFIDLLMKSGLSNHPEFVRTFLKVGQAISEDTAVTGSGDGARTNKQDRSHEAIAGRIYKKAG